MLYIKLAEATYHSETSSHQISEKRRGTAKKEIRASAEFFVDSVGVFIILY